MQSRPPKSQSSIYWVVGDKHGLAITNVDGKPSLLLFGGSDNDDRKVYRWDSKTEVWKQTDLFLSEYKYAFGYGVVPKSLICPNE